MAGPAEPGRLAVVVGLAAVAACRDTVAAYTSPQHHPGSRSPALDTQTGIGPAGNNSGCNPGAATAVAVVVVAGAGSSPGSSPGKVSVPAGSVVEVAAVVGPHILQAERAAHWETVH